MTAIYGSGKWSTEDRPDTENNIDNLSSDRLDIVWEKYETAIKIERMSRIDEDGTPIFVAEESLDEIIDLNKFAKEDEFWCVPAENS